MTHPVTGIDHCYLLVENLDRSQAQFERLGFTVSPRGFHSETMGSANHTIMFPDDYFELLGMIRKTPVSAERLALIAENGEGLYAIACRAGDVKEAEKQLTALGIKTSGGRSFERPVPLPRGGEAMAAFSVLQFEQDEVPVGLAFMCQHHTPENVWIPELLDHRNDARGLAGAVAAPANPEQAARKYARLFAAGKVSRVEGGWQVETGSAPITFLTVDALKARYEGIDVAKTPKGAFTALRILVEDLSRTRQALADAGVATWATSDGLAVGPEDASGTIIEFTPRA